MTAHHPIASTCLDALVESKAGEPFTLSAEGVERVTAELQALLRSPQLDDAVLTVVQLAQYLSTTHRSPGAGAQLVKLAATLATPILQHRGGTALAQLQESAASYRQFEDRGGARFAAARPPAEGQVQAGPGARFAMNVPSSTKK